MDMYLMDSREQFRRQKRLTVHWKHLDRKWDYAINVEVPDENIVNRMSGRRACVGCGATYHVEYAPTKVENVCDVCGADLILREDDQPETVLKASWCLP